MNDYQDIIQEINTNLPDNTEQLITAEILRETLIDFVNEVEDNEGELETAIQGKQDILTFDNTPTENSDNPVTSDGVYDALQTKADKVQNAVAGNFAGLDASGNLIDSSSNASDFATAAQGALADTAYQKPSTGIPASDLANGVIPAPEVFVATVNRTSYQEVTDALSEGKVVIAVEGNNTYYYTGLSFYNEYMFFSFLEPSYYVVVGLTNSNIWYTIPASELEFANNKVTSISSSSNDTQYPSAKCVYDTLLDYVKKSQTVGLLKNDGTVDTNTYLTQQDIVNKADKTSVVALTGTSATQELADNTIYQASELSSLTITIPNGVTPDYISQINFESGSTATTLTAPNTIIWFGDDLTNNVFVPAIGKQYVVIFYYDGVNVRSIVQSE